MYARASHQGLLRIITTFARSIVIRRKTGSSRFTDMHVVNKLLFHGIMISILAPRIFVQWSIFISESLEGTASINCTTKCGKSTLRIHGIINNQRCVVEWMSHGVVCNRFDSETWENVLPYNHVIGISREPLINKSFDWDTQLQMWWSN